VASRSLKSERFVNEARFVVLAQAREQTMRVRKLARTRAHAIVLRGVDILDACTGTSEPSLAL
jgi:hypothetical protein